MLKVGCQKILENGQTSGNSEMINKWAKTKSMTGKSHNQDQHHEEETFEQPCFRMSRTRFNND